MIVMRSKLLLVAAIGALALLVIVQLVAGAPEPPAVDSPPADVGGSARGRFKVPKIFDFETYKRMYKKSYATVTEALVRQQLVLAKIFRSLISQVNYKMGRLKHFLAVNPLSDMTPAELEQMENPSAGMFIDLPAAAKLADAAENFKRQQRANDNDDDTLLLVPSDKIEVVLEQIAEEYPDDKEVSELRAEMKFLKELKARKKRDLEASEQKVNKRQLSLDKLFNTGEGGATPAEALAKARRTSAYENPDHIEPELMSQGLNDQKMEIKWVELYSLKELEERDPVFRVNRLLAKYRDAVPFLAVDKQTNLEDKVFFDHRKSGCLWAPRYQNKCGSCYAFAIIAVAEWIHCKNTGELLAFSEQYIVDCGHYNELLGCSGGAPQYAGNFIHSFGVELRANYPYTHSQGTCPYDEDNDIKTTGYIRMDLGRSTYVPIDRLAEYIETGPMYLSISTKGGFHEYGGGVWDGAGCQPRPTHGVVLVGHGREDGEEYWLVRNSHSAAWGEGGHIKMSKKSDCIHPRFGMSFALQLGKDISKSELNKHHDISKIKDKYIKSL